MANNPPRVLWCFIIEGNSTALWVIPLGETIDELKHLVWKKGKNGIFRDVDAADLVLWKVSREGLADSSQLTSYLQLKVPEPTEPLVTILFLSALSREVVKLENPWATSNVR